MVFEKIKEIIINHLDLDPDYEIKSNSSIKDDLRADSVDAIEIIMELESEFGIEIDDESASEFETIADLEQYIEDAISQE